MNQSDPGEKDGGSGEEKAMKTFRIADVEKIEQMIADGKTVEIEWLDGALRRVHRGIVKSVRWDGLVFTTNGAVFTGLDDLCWIKEVA